MAGRLLQVSLGLLLLTSFYVAFSDTSVAPAFSSYGKAKGWFFVAMPVLPLDESGALALPEGVRRVIVDVGAHTQTHFLAQVAADPTLLLIALEPTPDLFLAHFQNVRHPRVVLLPVAASPKEGLCHHSAEC